MEPGRWGPQDFLERQRTFVAGPYEEVALDAGHRLMREETEAVIAAIFAHLRRVDGAASSGL